MDIYRSPRPDEVRVMYVIDPRRVAGQSWAECYSPTGTSWSGSTWDGALWGIDDAVAGR